jgi:phenylacetic acid degradation operon negative regulatory protein
MLFTLFGDYVHPAGRDIWLGGLVRVGRLFGLTETAVRSAVVRLTREGWLRSRRRGGLSFYGLSPAGRSLIEEGTKRIYRGWGQSWDKTWCLLVYSVPEDKRPLRDRMRKRLAWLGFGALGPGVYLSPRDRSLEVRQLVRHVGAARFVRVFFARAAPGTDDHELMRSCWDVARIAAAYRRFLQRWEPRFRADAARHSRGKRDGRGAFITRFLLTHEFRRFPFLDPDFPETLLPRDWPGRRARQLFLDYHELLGEEAVRFFASVSAPPA